MLDLLSFKFELISIGLRDANVARETDMYLSNPGILLSVLRAFMGL